MGKVMTLNMLLVLLEKLDLKINLKKIDQYVYSNTLLKQLKGHVI